MSERLGWTLVHFLWQGTLIASLYAAIRRALGPTYSPHARYLLACAVLAAMVAVPVVTFGVLAVAPASQPATLQPVIVSTSSSGGASVREPVLWIASSPGYRAPYEESSRQTPQFRGVAAPACG